MVRMLVTRPEPDASDTAGKLSALGIDPVVEPLLRYETLPTSLPGPEGFAALVLTSSNALRALNERGVLDIYRQLRTFAVGGRAAEAAKRLGFPDVVSAEGDARDLVALLAEARLAGPVLYPAARERSADLGKALARHGIMVITAEIYGMSPAQSLSAPVEAAIELGEIDAALFFSRRTAETFIELTGEVAGSKALSLLCMSEAVAAPFVKAHFGRVNFSDHPSEEAMLGLALSFARGQKQGMIAQ